MSGIERRNKISEQFAARAIRMLESPAYRVLSLSAHRVICRIEIELAHHGGKDNGKLPVTYDDFEFYGIHRHAIAPAIKEAVALGFIEVTEHGRAGNAEHRTPNLFRLTFKPSKGYMGHGTNEWAKIPDIETAERIAKEARTPSPRKNISQWRKTPNSSGGNHHRKRQIHSTESATTGHSAESTTTLDISGRGAASAPDTCASPVTVPPAKRTAGGVA
jgi:hypothetical protein